MLDYGGNIIVGDSTTEVTAHVTPSLSLNSRVVVNTINDAIPSIVEVAFTPSIKNDDRLIYGPGDVILIDVIFSQEVTIFLTDDDNDAPPQIALNIASSETAYGELLPPIQEGAFSRMFRFRYDVKTGHSQMELDFLASSTLHCNSYSFEDAIGRSVNVSLPAISLTASKTIIISDSRPVIKSVSVDLPTGEYAAGDEVIFNVTFDRHVTVTGKPLLPLNVQSSIAVLEILTTENLLPGSHFNLIYRDERSSLIPADASAAVLKDALESLQSLRGDACVSRSPVAQNEERYRWAIRLMGTNDSIVDLRLDDSGLKLRDGTAVANIVTTNSTLSDWSIDDGDLKMCTARIATYNEGSGTKSLLFGFRILPGDKAERLDVSNVVGTGLLYPRSTDSVVLMVNSPERSIIQADPKIEGIEIENDITIDTTPPFVTSIRPQESTTPSGVYAVGDTLFFEVSFDRPVEVS